MKKKLLLLVFLIAIAAKAQTFEWVKSQPIAFSSNPEMISYATACDPMGNVYTTGFQQNAFHYESIMGDLFYSKYNSSGELQFSKTFSGNGTVYSAVSDTAGNILLAIGYVNNIAIDGLSLSTTNQGVQALLVKFDPDGNLLWHENVAIENAYDCRMHAITTDSENNIYIGCYDFQHSYIRKLSPQGDLIFTIPQLFVKSITSISVDNEGNIYAAGSCAESSASYAGVAMPPPFFYNTFLAKYSATGIYKWVKYVDDITCPEPKVVAVTPDQVYFSSYLFGNFDFDAIETEGPSSMFSDVFIARLNANGIFQWVREVPGIGVLDPGNVQSLAADAQGNVYFAGATRGTIHWTNEISTSTGEGFNNDVVVLKYNPNGELLAAKTAGGSSGDRIDAIAVHNGEIFISGICKGTASFDNFSFTEDPDQNWPFVAKLTQSVLGLPQQQTETIAFYPNPSKDFIYMDSAKSISGSICNMLGQKVMAFTASRNNPIDVRALSKGTYIIKSDHLKSVKFLKN